MKKVVANYIYLLLVWGIFRLFFRFSDVIEEVIFKPVLWLMPLLALWLNERKKIRFFEGKLLTSLLWGGAIGLVFVMSLVLTHVTLPKVSGNGFWEYAGISLVTAVTEELVFSGYLFLKLRQQTKQDYLSLVLVLIMFAVIHIPIAVFVYKYSVLQLALYLGLVSLVSLGSLYVMMKTKNLWGAIVAHWSWSMAVFFIH